MMDEHGNAKKHESNIINRFKKAETPEIIIVVDKLLTGFDEPKNTVLYLTRNLQGHKLLQAIARVNRIYPDKEFGYIIDYYGVIENLDDALEMYSTFYEFDEDDLAGTLTNINEEIKKLPQKHSELWDIFGGVTDMGFPEKPKNQSAYNLFMAANLPGAIDRSGAEPIIDYSKLVVANGSLPQLIVIGGTIDANGITIGYQSNMLIPKVSETDELVAVLKTTIGEVLITRQPRGNDSESFISIAYPTINIADVKCCYLFVRSMDGKKASKSVFVALTS